jgi:hypothetical protein
MQAIVQDLSISDRVIIFFVMFHVTFSKIPKYGFYTTTDEDT